MSIWNHLTYTIGSTVGNLASAGINGLVKRDLSEPVDGIVYRTRKGYDNVLTFTAKRMVMGEISSAVKEVTSAGKSLAEKLLKLSDTTENNSGVYKQIIKDGVIVDAPYGHIKTKEGYTIQALNPYGEEVSDALMIYYDAETPITHTTKLVGGSDTVDGTSASFSTVTVCHIDIAPKVSLQSSKNLILTPVQGRNFTRKELVSGGDYVFQVNGEINSNEMGVYPDALVKKFTQIMDYNGIVNVNYVSFNNINVNKILIKDFALGVQEYKNIQPYTFTCVAVEQDEEVVINSDTINLFSYSTETTASSSWYKMLLNNKRAEIATEQTVTTGLSDLISNI